ncbi:hypothetical protein [Tengunoibacter tsumagoiensis]|uniref:Uncharacterized protein n=1 Tax=Tengunoibacter tsumagoiensis TaxID=2014871 RepID=A0A402A385_9CHLR|nr:hypothetical protein [Tengunoibacter tsumagoiensis]GCE13604.1 hypothetical protein KTT_34630 [Tengunoibacter tsumagoiensis]
MTVNRRLFLKIAGAASMAEALLATEPLTATLAHRQTNAVPLSIEQYHTLVLYQRQYGEATVYTIASSARLAHGPFVRTASYHGWSTSWDQAVRLQLNQKTGEEGVLFYDRTHGVIALYQLTAEGKLNAIRNDAGWAKTWDIFLPVFPGHNNKQCILSYDRSYGYAELHQITSDLQVKLQKGYQLGTGWDQILAMETDSAGLLFYSRAQSLARFYSMDESGYLSLKHDYPFDTQWDLLLSGAFGASTKQSLLCYSQKAGELRHYAVEHNGRLTLLANVTGLHHDWRTILAGGFTSNQGDQILCYDQQRSELQLYPLPPADNIQLNPLARLGIHADLLL